MRKRRNGKAVAALFVIAYLFFIGMMDYPYVARWINDRKSAEIIAEYRRQAQKEEKILDRVWNEAVEWNREMTPGTQIAYDAFGKKDTGETETEEETAGRKSRKGKDDGKKDGRRTYWDMLAVGDEGGAVMCTISIPAIDVSLPVYHGVADDVLQRGAGHIPWSSLPVGGEGTHCCIAAHRGLPDRTMFTDLDLLKKGDLIILNVLNRTLAYEVTGTEVVEPDMVENLLLRENDRRDLLTLVTCTPYGINTHRMYVHAERTEYDPEKVRENRPGISDWKAWLKLNWYKIATVILLIAMILTVRSYLKSFQTEGKSGGV